MNLYLKDGESVLRSWDYAKRKGKTKGKLNLTVTNNRIISTSYHRNRIERKEFEVSAVKSVDAFTGIRKAGFWRTFLAIILFVYSLALLFPVIMYLNGINLLGEIGKNLAINYFCLFLLFIIFGILLLRRRNLFALRIILRANLIPTVIKKSNRLTGAFYLIPLLITLACPLIWFKLRLPFNSIRNLLIINTAFVLVLLSWIITIKKIPLGRRRNAIKNPNKPSRVKIKVNRLVAKEILEEIGAVIIDAKEKTYPQQIAMEKN